MVKFVALSGSSILFAFCLHLLHYTACKPITINHYLTNRTANCERLRPFGSRMPAVSPRSSLPSPLFPNGLGLSFGGQFSKRALVHGLRINLLMCYNDVQLCTVKQ